MHKIKDQQLIEELQKRFSDNIKSLRDQEELIKQLEMVNQKLKESESLKSNFLSNIKNEINNPVTSILGLSQTLLKSDKVDPDLIKRIALHIHNEISSLHFQLKNIFTAAEIEAGEAYLESTEVNIEELIQELMEELKSTSEAKRITVIFKTKGKKSKLTTSLDQFRSDRKKLHLIVLNLLSNAIEFTPEKGKITITAEVKKKALSITFKDSGKGIKESEKKELFNRFRQLSRGMRKEHKGHGLGLAVTKGLVELLQGEISFESEENKGSSFTLTFRELEGPSSSTDENEFLFINHEKF